MCGWAFDTKGKRDGHREREHRQSVLVTLPESTDQTMTRSGAGTFVCLCREEYQRSWTLRRQSAGCEASIFNIQHDSGSLEHDEGTHSSDIADGRS